MPILYALIARGKTVLAEHALASGNFPTITRALLAKIPDADGCMSYVYDEYVFHYVVENHVTYICMCDDSQSGKRRLGCRKSMVFRREMRVRQTMLHTGALLLPVSSCIPGTRRPSRIFKKLRRGSFRCTALRSRQPSPLP